MKNISYYVVHGWMVNELHLKGNELLIFAIIYGFSQDGRSHFSGSLKYLERCTGATQPTVMKALKSLQEKKIITKYKRRRLANGVDACDYAHTQETWVPIPKKLGYHTQETWVYNINNNIKNKINIPFLDFWNLYNRKVGDKKLCQERWRKLTDDERAQIMKILPAWLSVYAKDKKYQIYPEGFLGRRRWEDDLTDYDTGPSKTSPHKVIKQRMNGAPSSTVKAMEAHYVEARRLASGSDRAQVSRNLCDLHDWIVKQRPADAMEQTEHSEDIKSPVGLIGEYLWWLGNESWIKGISENTFMAESKLFKNFLKHFGEEIGLNPLTGRY